MTSSLAAFDRRARLDAISIVVLCVLFAVAVWWWLPHDALMRLTDEKGPVEQGSALLYFVAAAYVLVDGVPQATPSLRLPLSIALFGFGARELDLHKAFTDTSVLKVSFYLGDAPWAHKLLALAVVLSVLAALGTLLIRYTHRVWQGLRQGHPVSVTVAVFAVTVVVAKIFDRSRMVLLEDFGIDVGESLGDLLISLEETLELGLPLIVMVGPLRLRRRIQRAANTVSTPV